MQQIPASPKYAMPRGAAVGLSGPWQATRNGAAMSQRAPPHPTSVHFGTSEPADLHLLGKWLGPLVSALNLWICLQLFGQGTTPAYVALAVAAVMIGRTLLGTIRFMRRHHPASAMPAGPTGLPRLTLQWSGVVLLLLIFGNLLSLAPLYSRHVLISWFVLTPIAIWLAQFAALRMAERWRAVATRHIIIGANNVGLELARRAAQSLCLGEFKGFFDFRDAERLPESSREHLAGKCHEVADFVRRHGVEAIYIALPLSNAPRIEQLLEELRDTTASIYFVPDLFAFDLMQPRCVEINGMPAYAICDTPFTGMNAVRKRAVDLLLAIAVTLLIWPLLLAIAIAVKVSSAGPVLFKQRRYGLNGEEIVVYKFRSMTVCEDGPVVTQATRADPRITPLGRLLRRTSLDELPQLLNVLEGKMSFVGPRPHAIAHNEQYRKLISGYMRRHKVRPGITGWAQVNGLRGETETVDKMRARIQFDLDYLRNWSLMLDARIIARTALLVLRDGGAY
jgi:putative colanic acid biosynthesis UDP-glucose lipid carrier transferase